MKFIPILALLSLAGCSTTQTDAVLKDLQGCERHYNGVIAAGALIPGSFSGSVKIDCPNANGTVTK